MGIRSLTSRSARIGYTRSLQLQWGARLESTIKRIESDADCKRFRATALKTLEE